MTDNTTLSAEASLTLADSYFVDNEFELAIDAYAAAEILACHDIVRFRSLSHKSAALLQLGRYEEARKDATASLEFCLSGGLRQGETEACHRRLGQSLLQLGCYYEALRAYEQAKQLALLNQRDISKYTSLIQQCNNNLVSSKRSSPSPPPVSPVATQPSVAKLHRPTMPKYQYYQNDTFMKIEILEHSVQQEDIRVDFSPRKLTVTLMKQGVEFTVIHGILYDKVDINRCKLLIKDEKVLIKLRKTEPHDWHELFGKNTDDDDVPSDQALDEIPKTGEKVRPYTSSRDWNAIERNIKKDEENEKPEGDEAMNKLFQKIYSNANEETRRAMIKSFQTSGGTVLSTNWDEVKEKDYEGKDRVAAKGQEWKDREGKKLPQKE